MINSPSSHLPEREKRLTTILLHSVFALLAVLAVLFYHERLFADASYYLFRTLNSGFFRVEHQRFVLVFSELLPLLGYYLGIPLKGLMIIASLGHVLFFYLIFYFVYHRLHDTAGAVSLVLLQVVLQKWLFFTPMPEMCYGAALMILFFSMIRARKARKPIQQLILFVLAFFAITSHFEIAWVFGVLLVYFLFFEKTNRQILVPVIAAGIVFALIKLGFQDQYETSRLDNLVGPNAFQWLHLNYLHKMLALLIKKNFGGFYFMLIALMYLAFRKRWSLMLLFGGGWLILLILVQMVGSPNADSWYTTIHYFPLLAMAILTFTYLVYPSKKSSLHTLAILIFLLITTVSTRNIVKRGEVLKMNTAQMVQWIKRGHEEPKYSKFIIGLHNAEQSFSDINWALPIETLMISAEDGPDSSLTIASSDDLNFNDNQAKLRNRNYMFRKFEIMPLSWLNHRLFRLKPGPYRSLNNLCADSLLHKLGTHIQVEPLLNKPLYVKPGSVNYIPVRIKNGEKIPIPSNAIQQVNLSYHIYKNGKLFIWDGVRTPLEVDVIDQFTQQMKLHSPQQSGKYEVVCEMVGESAFWTQCRDTLILVVN